MSFGKRNCLADFICPFNFQWHDQNKVGNIAILVLWRNREKSECYNGQSFKTLYAVHFSSVLSFGTTLTN